MHKVLQRPRAGMTLVEVMVAVVILLVAVIGILYSYVKAIELNAIGQGAVIATHAVKNKIEQIKSCTFAQIVPTYDNTTFTVAGINGKGVVYIDNSNAQLLKVKVVVCWKLGNGRLIGEDKNLNGQVDAGEDTNGNGELDSYVQIITQIYG
ncbi:MAG: prepilin-type N-terminal cleavage/methylation domain-containing protein [Candidatus Omnitrophica bacterium]|nr:prepilin-type N-terminal cleavage/methylation domain-containing protein [Candidatus Omnitrophota bacterium]